MSGITTMVRRFMHDDDGIAITEYGILLALLAVILIIAVNLFGSNFTTWWNGNVAGITSKISTGTTAP